MFKNVSLILFLLITKYSLLTNLIFAHCYFLADREPGKKAWPLHIIHNSPDSPDGVKKIDANGDGFLDIVTPWEQGGFVKIHLHPTLEDSAALKENWPFVIVGEKLTNPEDAIFVDLDRDGAIDVVSSTEEGSIFIHWAPKNPSDYLVSSSWKTELLFKYPRPILHSASLQIDNINGDDLVFGSKDGHLFWMSAPAQPRLVKNWKFHTINKQFNDAWPMSLLWVDVDADGKKDLLVTLRKGDSNIVGWLRQPQSLSAKILPWRMNIVYRFDDEPQFSDFSFTKYTKNLRLVVPTRDKKEIHLFEKMKGSSNKWLHEIIRLPQHSPYFSALKAAKFGNLDHEDDLEIVLTTVNSGETDQHGIFYLKKIEGSWIPIALTGVQPTKYDLVELIDVDEDGDLDIIACEEINLNALFWLENTN